MRSRPLVVIVAIVSLLLHAIASSHHYSAMAAQAFSGPAGADSICVLASHGDTGTFSGKDSNKADVSCTECLGCCAVFALAPPSAGEIPFQFAPALPQVFSLAAVPAIEFAAGVPPVRAPPAAV